MNKHLANDVHVKPTKHPDRTPREELAVKLLDALEAFVNGEVAHDFVWGKTMCGTCGEHPAEIYFPIAGTILTVSFTSDETEEELRARTK